MISSWGMRSVRNHGTVVARAMSWLSVCQASSTPARRAVTSRA